MTGLSGNRSTIVLLDDEPAWLTVVARLLADMPETAGARIRTFDNDDDATRFVQGHADEIIGFIQDLNRDPDHEYTGGAEGIRFLDEVVARYAPWARTIVLSGYLHLEQAKTLYASKRYQAIVAYKADLDLDEFRTSVRWLLNVGEPSLPVPDARPSTVHPSIDVIDLPWDEVRDYLARNPDFLHTMHPRTFERLVAEFFQTRGWEVELTARTRDGGYDIIAVRSNKPTTLRVLIEAKRFSPGRPVGVGIVRSLYAVRHIAHASQVVLATSSRVSKSAKQEFIHVVPWEIDFIEREQLLSWCREFRAVYIVEDGV